MDLYQIPAYRVMWRSRRLFQRLGSEFEPLHRAQGVSTSQRAVLEFLDREGPQTVPGMARRRGVSRQHVQTLVNDLLERGWVETVPNPAHRRSSLIQMTRQGKAGFQQVVGVDALVAEKINAQISPQDLEVTERTLEAIEQFFETGDWHDLKATHT